MFDNIMLLSECKTEKRKSQRKYEQPMKQMRDFFRTYKTGPGAGKLFSCSPQLLSMTFVPLINVKMHLLAFYNCKGPIYGFNEAEIES